jgi:hypothetical protein
LADPFTGQKELLEFFEYAIHHFDGDRFERGYRLRDFLDLIVREVLHDLSSYFLTERDHDDGHALAHGNF